MDELDTEYTNLITDRTAADAQAIADATAGYEQDLEDAVNEATRMDENVIYEVCTKIDEIEGGSMPVRIRTVGDDDAQDA